MNKRKFFLAGLGIFLAGLLVGGAGMALFHKMRMSPLVHMEQNGPVAFFMDRMDRHLHLTDAQKESIRPIIADVVHEIEAARAPCLAPEEDAIQTGRDKVAAQLSPDQAKKFEAFMDRAKERRKKFLGQH